MPPTLLYPVIVVLGLWA